MSASNQLRDQADDYLRKHRIMELFEVKIYFSL